MGGPAALPRILFRYILKEVAYPSLLALGGLTLILFLAARAPGFRNEHLAFLIMRMFFRPDVENSEMLYIIGTILPSLMMFILPMALLVGILIGVGRMTLDLEVRAMQTGGIPLYILFLPVLLLSVAASGLIGFMNYAPEPLMIRGSMQRVAKLLVSEFSSLEPGRVYDEIFGDDSNMSLYFDGRDDEQKRMEGVTLLVGRSSFEPNEEEEQLKDLYKLEERRLSKLYEAGEVSKEEMDRVLYDIKVSYKEQNPVMIFASSASFDADPENGQVELELFEGSMHVLDPESAPATPASPGDAPVAGAEKAAPPRTAAESPAPVGGVVTGMPSVLAAVPPVGETPAEPAGSPELVAAADAQREYTIINFGRMRKVEYLGGFEVSENRRTQTMPELFAQVRNPDAKDRERLRAKATLLERISGSFKCFVLAFIGLPLAVSVRPSGKSIGVVIAFALILIYEWVLRTGYTMVETGHVLGVLVIFLPNILFVGAGLFLWRQSLRA